MDPLRSGSLYHNTQFTPNVAGSLPAQEDETSRRGTLDETLAPSESQTIKVGNGYGFAGAPHT